jgi:biopolymer transport protein TolQ
LATALGLVAAIPAVIFYNRLSREIDGYADRLGSFADEVTVEIDRQMDREPAGRVA